MCKVADGLLSGRYSVPSTRQTSSGGAGESGLLYQAPTPVFQDGIRPVTFKTVIGKGHAEFSTMKQQDSEEFLTYLVQTLRRDVHKFKSQGLGTSPHSPPLVFLGVNN